MSTTLLERPAAQSSFDEIVASLTRRGLIGGGLGIAAGVGLSACGDGAGRPASSSTGGTVISHEYGSTTVPPNPKRVATVGYNDQDFALALGTVPVTTRAWYENYNELPWVRKATGGKGVRETVGEGSIKLEAIAAAKPDVILGLYEDISPKMYQRLSAIAPTVVKAAKYPGDEIPWREELRLTGLALGKEAQAKRQLAEVDAKVAAAKKAHPEFAGKVLVVDFGPSNGGHWLLPAGDPRRVLFDELGFRTQHASKEISGERVSLLDHDVLFIQGATRKQMEKSPLFSRLKVVREGRTLYTGFDSNLSAALSYVGPKSLLYALDVLVPQLANALSGQPVADLTDA